MASSSSSAGMPPQISSTGILDVLLGSICEPFTKVRYLPSLDHTIEQLFKALIWGRKLKIGDHSTSSFYFIQDRKGHPCGLSMKISDYLIHENKRFIRLGFINQSKNTIPDARNGLSWEQAGLSPTLQPYHQITKEAQFFKEQCTSFWCQKVPAKMNSMPNLTSMKAAPEKPEADYSLIQISPHHYDRE